MDNKAHIKTELEIIESYLPWKEYMDRNEMPKHIEADVYAKAESKWVSIDWLKDALKQRIHENKDCSNWFESQEDEWFLSLLEG